MTYGKRAGRTVLVVEKNDRAREPLVRALVGGGYDAHGVASGLAALSALLNERERYALMVIGLGLPDIAAEELARRSRALAPWLRVLFIAAKPLRRKVFLAAVADALAGS